MAYSNVQNAPSAILSTFTTELPFVIKIFVLSIFELPFYTGSTVLKRLLRYAHAGTSSSDRGLRFALSPPPPPPPALLQHVLK